jgi:hypothetical protein
MGYSPARKAAVLKRMLPPNNMAIRQLSKEEGISEGTLHAWHRRCLRNCRIFGATSARSEKLEFTVGSNLPFAAYPQPQYSRDAALQALRLPKRLLEHHAQRQTHFNRQIRIHRLATRCRAPWSRPHRKCIFADSNSQIATPPQAFIVIGAVGHPMLLLRDLSATISVEFVRHSRHPDGNKPRQYQPTADLCNKALPHRRRFITLQNLPKASWDTSVCLRNLIGAISTCCR